MKIEDIIREMPKGKAGLIVGIIFALIGLDKLQDTQQDTDEPKDTDKPVEFFESDQSTKEKTETYSNNNGSVDQKEQARFEDDDKRKSYNSHKQAGQRKAPVELGEVYEVLVTEETKHHSGRRDLVGKYEGFVIFVTNAPEKMGPGNVVNAKITSFNKKGTSAQAKFVESGSLAS